MPTATMTTPTPPCVGDTEPEPEVCARCFGERWIPVIYLGNDIGARECPDCEPGELG